MKRPDLVGRHALAGRAIALSVSDSADLSRLGLLPEHCRVAVAEIARAVFLARGEVVYGGNLDPAGFTPVLLEEALDYSDARGAFVLVLAHTVHREQEDEALRSLRDRLGVTGRLVLLGADGQETDIARRDRTAADPSTALSAMRAWVTETTDARVLVGGKLRGHQGQSPGVVEEALSSLRARHPLYVAGGFGGAACAVAQWLGETEPTYWPEGLPEGMLDDPVAAAGREVAAEAVERAPNGLAAEESALLAVTHRAGDIASLVTAGAARVIGED